MKPCFPRVCFLHLLLFLRAVTKEYKVSWEFLPLLTSMWRRCMAFWELRIVTYPAFTRKYIKQYLIFLNFNLTSLRLRAPTLAFLLPQGKEIWKLRYFSGVKRTAFCLHFFLRLSRDMFGVLLQHFVCRNCQSFLSECNFNQSYTYGNIHGACNYLRYRFAYCRSYLVLWQDYFWCLPQLPEKGKQLSPI
jgi:hypothetical protein